MYAVDRDFGFAPNPFHGYCTLACCKARIRNPAQIGDWVFGLGGTRLKATGRCIYAMRVTDKISFDEYWHNRRYIDKRVVPNGSKRVLVGDNIYHRDLDSKNWVQEDSHHSNSDGSTNITNLKKDTASEFVLISEQFYYFGSAAPMVPPAILEALEYKNNHNHWRFELAECRPLVEWVESTYSSQRNRVVADPFDFAGSHRRYDAKQNKVI